MNLYRMASEMRYNTAAIASCVVTVNMPSTVISLMCPVPLTLTARISMATIAMMPMMEPQMLSKNAVRNYESKEGSLEVNGGEGD